MVKPIIVAPAEFEEVVAELSERMFDFEFLRNRVREVLCQLHLDKEIDPKQFEDGVTVEWQFRFEVADILQILGRSRRSRVKEGD